MKKLFYLVLALSFVLTGCNQTKVNQRNSVSNNSAKKVTSSSLSQNNPVSIKTVISKDDPNVSDSPATVVRMGLQYELSNGNKVYASTKDMKWSFSLDNHSVVAASVPETFPRWYTLGLLLNNSNGWKLEGITNPSSVPSTNPGRDNLRGIDLPKGNYATENPLPFGGSTKGLVWNFSNQDRVIIIALFPKTPFSLPKGAKHFNINGSDAWSVSQQQGNVAFAFTVDEGNVVLIGGDVTEKQAIALLKSLPPASSGTFPFQ